MADFDLQSLGMRLGEAITPTPSNAPQVRYATVAAVNGDGTLDVTIDGTTLRGVCATTGCVGAAVGMRCVVLRQGPLATVVGLIAGNDLGNIVLPNAKSIYGTNSNSEPKYVFEPRNASDNCAINYIGYAESNSDTEIYGNEVNITSRSMPTINGAKVGVVSDYNNTGWRVIYRPDGWVEMRKDVTASLTYAAWGSAYEAKITDAISYPLAFRDRPAIHVEPYRIITGGIMGFEFSTWSSKDYFPAVYAMRPNTVSGSSIGVELVAYGPLA